MNRSSMAIYTNLPIYKDLYTLLVKVASSLPHLPKDCKYSLAADLRNKVLEMIVMVYRANKSRYRLPIIERMQEQLVEVSVYIRVMCDLKYISQKRYVEWVEQVSVVSKQLVAWERSQRSQKE